ncbi:regulator of G-protein signaling [Acrasis kona]|uniref:Regulator of G-protein signaling n=1 Tax=Acrasis kona TaxID=1008807 RepID=A0AAW2Z1J5_9EUKA
MESPGYFAKFLKDFAAGNKTMEGLTTVHDKDNYLSMVFDIKSGMMHQLKHTTTILHKISTSKYLTRRPSEGAELMRIPASFLIDNGKVVKEFRQSHIAEKCDHIDMLKIPEDYGVITTYEPITYDVLYNDVYCTRASSLKARQSKRQFSLTSYIHVEPQPEPVQEVTMRSVLSNPKQVRFFHLYSTKQHSEENITFWKEVNYRYKKQTSEEDRMKVAKNIIEVFVDDDAIMCINVSGSMKQDLLNTLRNHGASIDLFDTIIFDLEVQILIHLFETFTDSVLYKDMLSSKVDE